MDTRTREVRRPGHGYSLIEDDPDKIKHEIDRTRADLDETVNELSSRLAPRRMVDDFVDMFTDRRERLEGAEPGSRDVLRSLREHPIPAALIGAGVAWFLFERARPTSHTTSYEEGRQVGRHDGRDWLAPGATFEPGRPGETHRRAGEHREGGGLRDRIGDSLESGKEHLRDTGRSVRGWAEHAGESISESAHGIKDRISHAAGSMRERMSSGAAAGQERAHDLRERASDFRHRAEDLGHRAGDTARNVRHVVEDHPLVIGAAALAIGLFAGLAVPSTRREREVMGPVRDEMMDEAGRIARERVIPKVREAAHDVAQKTGQAVADEAASEVSDEHAPLGKRASKVASAGIHAAGDALRDEMHKHEGGKPPQPGSSAKWDDPENRGPIGGASL
jgi:gas vesicle protein